MRGTVPRAKDADSWFDTKEYAKMLQNESKFSKRRGSLPKM